MLDIRLIREQPDIVREGLAKVGADAGLVGQVLALNEKRRALETEAGGLKNQRNVGSKQIGQMKDEAGREALKAEMRAIGDKISALDGQLSQVEADQLALMLTIPNLPAPDVPVGKDE